MPKEQGTDRERLDVDDGSLLPDREVMSILPIEPTGTYPDLGAVGPTPDATTAGPGAGAADDASGVADKSLDTAGGGEESVTSDDRSETISQSDTASAGS
jgi:hypothetical protein